LEKFKRDFSNYLLAIDCERKSSSVKTGVLLSVIGDRAGEVFEGLHSMMKPTEGTMRQSYRILRNSAVQERATQGVDSSFSKGINWRMNHMNNMLWNCGS